MDRRNFFKNIGLGAAALVVSGCSDIYGKKSLFSNDSVSLKIDSLNNSKPNIILIMADDLGYGDLGCYGSTKYQTPNLDAMAANGMMLKDYHSNGAVCSPTRAALLTGRYQQWCGIEGVITAANNRDDGMALKETTFAEVLKTCGYATGIFGKWHLGYKVDFNPVKQGFDEFIGFVSGNVDYQTHIDQAKYDDWWKGLNLQSETGYSTSLITQHGLDFIEKHKDGPFCLYLPHEAPHYPYQGPDDPPIRVHGKADRKQTPSEKKAAYKEMIEAMDKSVGDIIARIKSLGIEKNTFIFFCSDNGPATYGTAGPLRGKKGSVWEGGHRVPAIAYWPGKIPAGTINTQTVLGMDMMPTMAALAGSDPLDQLNLDGINILPTLLENKPLSERTLFWRAGAKKAVRKSNWKLVNISGNATLYNLDDDLGESKNIASSNPDKFEQLKAELAAWEAQFKN